MSFLQAKRRKIMEIASILEQRNEVMPKFETVKAKTQVYDRQTPIIDEYADQERSIQN